MVFPFHCKKYPQNKRSMCTARKGKAGDALPCWVPLPSLRATLRRLLRVLSQLNGAMGINPDISGSVRRTGRYSGIFEFTVSVVPRGQTCKCTKKSDPVFTGSLQAVNKVRNRQNEKPFLTISMRNASVLFLENFKQLRFKKWMKFFILTYFGTRALPYLCTPTGASYSYSELS